MEKEVILGFSGGVDSFYSAYLLKQQGFKVFPVLFRLSGKEDIKKAEKSAELLGLKLTVIDYRELFRKVVVDYFINSYRKGITPNPCVVCNREIKMKKLYELSLKTGIPLVATGHYARCVYSADFSQKVIVRGVERNKEQSYFLSMVSRDIVDRLILPLENLTKNEVINGAESLGFNFSGESQDICFIKGSLYSFLRKHIGKKKGIFVLSDGTEIGKFNAFYRYTVGQRRGLGISYRHPLYVLKIDVENNKIILGSKDELLKDSFYVKDTVWQVSPEKFRDRPVEVQVRHRGKTAAVKEFILLKNGRIFVKLQASLEAPTPGQVCAFYSGNTLLGGGEITTL
ncbi:tRNA 2-thiouridine(34) synthase MnmA [Desulfurobacterium sp. TC5-1]|uniref:tRNA 2-thiouridine(34) synthase MnmA n=1 Tax=Desulfurobacterium sp. TC5-1 TaxID=1158318 RepID=UPI0004063BF8|nr:tRNA 2-thiouridine(34) synthase MnmA [Desulfurobacterium sp. TC5-1]